MTAFTSACMQCRHRVPPAVKSCYERLSVANSEPFWGPLQCSRRAIPSSPTHPPWRPGAPSPPPAGPAHTPQPGPLRRPAAICKITTGRRKVRGCRGGCVANTRNTLRAGLCLRGFTCVCIYMCVCVCLRACVVTISVKERTIACPRGRKRRESGMRFTGGYIGGYKGGHKSGHGH